MNARALPAKIEEHAQIMLTLTPAHVGLALLASTVKPTSSIALKGEDRVVEISHVVLHYPAAQTYI